MSDSCWGRIRPSDSANKKPRPLLRPRFDNSAFGEYSRTRPLQQGHHHMQERVLEAFVFMASLIAEKHASVKGSCGRNVHSAFRPLRPLSSRDAEEGELLPLSGLLFPDREEATTRGTEGQSRPFFPKARKESTRPGSGTTPRSFPRWRPCTGRWDSAACRPCRTAGTCPA